MDPLEATTSLPYEHRERAAAGLRAQHRLKVIDRGVTPDWSTFEVTGPVEVPDVQGRPWFEYRGKVHSDH